MLQIQTEILRIFPARWILYVSNSHLTLTAVGGKTVVENVMVSYVSAQSQIRAASSFELMAEILTHAI